MSALGDEPQCLPVLITLGATLRQDVASALREVIATGAWQSEVRVRSAAAHWREGPRFHVFLDHGLEKRRNRGPKYEHLNAALLTFPETRAALYRVSAAECPQHCRTETATFAEDRHVADYRQALFGWYAAIKHAHACVVRAARWFANTQPSYFRRPEAFTDWMSGTQRRHNSGTVQETGSAAQQALQEIILMMHAWSPHTFEAIDVAFQKAEGEDASHAWGGSFEPAGRPEAQAAAEALANVLSPRNASMSGRSSTGSRPMTRTATWTSRRTALWPAPATGTAPTAPAPVSARTAPRPEAACTRRPPSPGATASTARPTLPGWPGSCSDPVPTESRPPLPWHEPPLPGTPQRAPQVWHDNAETLREAREAAGLDLNDAAGHLGVKPATLQRFEQATGKLPGRPVSLGYLQLLTLTCTQAGRTAPACIPQAISQPVISLPTTL
ncbi:hypothetical protein SHKM778_95940 (plasmid) [Streptomyces sp. KM77-8]|uniref:HTH cro/C1-type domain-containing protein n=1 Tax=Streptomyces haneummycinicus TaxID=3074435 RepID=A0AAT9I0H7_9ACTN